MVAKEYQQETAIRMSAQLTTICRHFHFDARKGCQV